MKFYPVKAFLGKREQLAPSAQSYSPFEGTAEESANPPRRQRASPHVRYSAAWSLAAVFIMLMSPVASRAQTPPAQNCSSTGPAYCPGASNPIGSPKNAVVFPSDGVLAFTPGPSGSNQTLMHTLVTADFPLSETNEWNIPGAFQPSTTYAAAAGHIIAPGAQTSGNFGYPEDVVYVWRNGNSYQVDFANPAHAQFGGIQLTPESWDGTQLAPRLDAGTYGPSTDFVSVAVGDLDGAVDANGELHDEVAVAFPVVDSEGTWKIEVYVLNFTNATDKNSVVITENNTERSMCGPNCFASTSSFSGSNQNQNAILSSGNVISLAIGDFDGDGTNELAAAHVADSGNIWISLFRYWNGGTVANSNLWWLPDYDHAIAQIDSNASPLGSLSLVSGDFNNDGKDELALGYGLWKKNSTHTVNTSGESDTCLVNWDQDGTTGLNKHTCDYWGYAIAYTNYITTFRSSLAQVNPTAISAGTTTTFALTNAHQIVTSRVFIQGGTGDWAGINGSFPLIALNDQGFTINVDSSGFAGTPNISNIWVSTVGQITAGNTATIDPRGDNPGAKWGTTLPNIFDFRDNDSRPVIQLASGLFSFDPNGADPTAFQQRQIVAIWNTPSPSDYGMLQQTNTQNLWSSPLPWWPYDLVAGYVTVSTDGADTPTLASVLSLPTTPYGKSSDFGNKYGYSHQRISIAASNYFGAADTANDSTPTWQFVIGTLLDSNGSAAPYSANLGSINGSSIFMDPNGNVTFYNGNPAGYEAAGSFPVVAFDPDGSSYLLGSPVHMQVSSFDSPGLIMEEPPKEMFWQPTVGSVPGFINNINRNSNTYTSITNSDTSSEGVQHSSTSGHDEGGGASVSAGLGIKENGLLVSSKFTVQDTASFKYEHNRQVAKANGTSTSVTTTAENMAKNDDFLSYSATSYDIWRYRIYGAGSATDDQGNPSSTNPYKFYEITVPGPTANTNPTAGTGLDWYRPFHENGNVLSYPPQSQSGIPVDVSPNPYTVDGQVPGGLTNGIMWSGNNPCYGGASGGGSITITGVTDSSKQITNSNTFQEDNDLKIGYKINFVDTVSANASVDLTFNAKQSLSSSTITSNSTSTSNAFAYSYGSFPSEWEYKTFPTLYNSLSGATKMSFAVNPQYDGCSGNKWVAFNQADPGLLLPNRFQYLTTNSSGDIFELTADQSREETKSLVMENPIPNPVNSSDGSAYDILTTAPVPGQAVQLSLPVYNFSIATPANNVTVKFSMIAVDDATHNEQGCNATSTDSFYTCPNAYRTQVLNQDGSSVDVANVNIPNWTDNADAPNYMIVRTPWTIPTSLAPGRYRIYVNLVYGGTETNPPQAVCTQAPCPPLCPPTAESCSAPTQNSDPNAPGQNNEGYYEFSIGDGTLLQGGATRPKVDVKTTRDSLVAVNTASRWNQIGFGFVGRSITMRVSAVADGTELHHHRATVTDRNLRDGIAGKPASTTQIAGKILQGANPNGSSAFFHWVPQTAGLHRLNAEVEEFADDKSKGNNKASMIEVIFRAPGDINGDGSIDADDLAFIEHDLGKRVSESACGYACDLNGDGWITKVDEDLLMSQCTSDHCAAGSAEHKRASIDKVRELNRQEMKALHDLRLKDWMLLVKESRQQDLPSVESLYMRSIVRAASVPMF